MLQKLFIYFLLTSCISGIYAQKDSSIKQILDQTAATFNQNNGIEATFTITTNYNSSPSNSIQGNIKLKGDKFHIETPSTIIWFDGETQWSYLPDNEEVNISTPTVEELQNINPYAFIQLYQKNYTYHLENQTTYKGHNIYAINLHAEDKQANIQDATLYIDKRTYQLWYIKIYDNQQNNSEIEILSVKKAINLPDSVFEFNPQKYPKAEIIDLR